MTNQTLYFSVNGGNIKAVDPFIAADSINYVIAEFSFDDSWEELIKTAVFRKDENVYHVVLEDNCCKIPFEVITDGVIYVSVFGVIDATRATTTEVAVQVEKSGYVVCEPQIPTADPYASFLQSATEQREQAESAALRAEEAATEAESAKSTAQSASIITIEQKNQAAKSAASAAEHASSAEEAVANAQSASQRAAGSSASAQSAAQSAAASSATAEFASEAAKALAESAEVSAKVAKEASKVVLQPNSYYANAIKGRVRLDTLSSSDREIILTDVSPIEHELNFRITSDIISVSGLTFLKSGKNLCPAPELGTTTTEAFKLPYQRFVNNKYTFSTNASGWYGILWEGGKSANVPTTFHNGETFTLTSANDEITIEGSTKWLGDGYYVQIERGTAATDYEEYSELQTVTTNSDGTVDGLISVSPTTIIEGLPPDSIISCEYNVDTKMYIDNMIASLVNASAKNA